MKYFHPDFPLQELSYSRPMWFSSLLPIDRRHWLILFPLPSFFIHFGSVSPPYCSSYTIFYGRPRLRLTMIGSPQNFLFSLLASLMVNSTVPRRPLITLSFSIKESPSNFFASLLVYLPLRHGSLHRCCHVSRTDRPLPAYSDRLKGPAPPLLFGIRNQASVLDTVCLVFPITQYFQRTALKIGMDSTVSSS